MIGPSSAEVTDSYLWEHAYGRPIGHDNQADREYHARRTNTDNCGTCGQQVLWVDHEGHRQALSRVEDGELDVRYEGGRLRAVPGVTHGIHRCKR